MLCLLKFSLSVYFLYNINTILANIQNIKIIYYNIIYCSQKVGDIWTLKIVALTKAMTHIWNSQFWLGK